MNLSIKIRDGNPFSWLAWVAVAVTIYAHFTTTSVPAITFILLGSVFLYTVSVSNFIKSVNTWYFCYACLLLVYVFLVSVIGPQETTGMTKMIVYQIIVCVCFYMYVLSGERNLDKVIFMISVAVLILCAMILTDEELFETIVAANEGSVYYSLGENNRNTIGVILAVGALCMLHRGFAKRRIWFIFMAVAVVLGLITGSRKVVVAVVVGTILYVYLYSRFFPQKTGGKRRKMVLVILIAMAVMIYACFNNTVLYSIIGVRLEGLWQTITGVGEGEASAVARSAMIRKALEMFEQKPILGWGIEGFAMNSGFGVYSHNNYTETLVSFGLFGFALMYIFKFLILFKQYQLMKIRKGTEQILQYIIIFVLMAVSLALDYAAISMNSIVSNLPFALAAAQQYLSKREKRT